MLSRAIENLLSNGLEASSSGDRVKLRTRSAPDGIEIAVEDQGPGVADELRELPFRGFASTKQLQGGLGLGLAVVRQVAEAHGGRVTVAPGPERGSRFVLVIPR
jgi:signal transduction histidine kinase